MSIADRFCCILVIVLMLVSTIPADTLAALPIDESEDPDIVYDGPLTEPSQDETVQADTIAPVILQVFQSPIDPSARSKVNVTTLVSDDSNLTVTARYGFNNSTWTNLSTIQGLENHTYESRVPGSGYTQTKLERTYSLTGNLTYLNVYCYDSYNSMKCKIEVYHESDDKWEIVWFQGSRWLPDPGTKVDMHFLESNITKWRILLYDFDSTTANLYYNFTARVLERSYSADLPAAGAQNKVYFYFNATDAEGNTANSHVYNYTIDRIAPILKDFTDLKGFSRSGAPIPVFTNFTDNRRIGSARVNWSLDNSTWHHVDMAKVTGSVTSAKFRGGLPVPSANTTCYYKVEVLDDGGNQANSTVRSFRWNPPPRFGDIFHDPPHPNNTTKVKATAWVTDADTVSIVKAQYSSPSMSWTQVNATATGSNWTGQIPPISGERWIHVRFLAWDSEGGVNTSQVYIYYVDEEKASIYKIVRDPDFPGINTTVNVNAYVEDLSQPVNSTLQYGYDNSTWKNRSMTDLTGYKTYVDRHPATGTATGLESRKMAKTYDLQGELQHLWVMGWSNDVDYHYTDIDGYNESAGKWQDIYYRFGWWSGPLVKVDMNLSHRGFTKVRIHFYDWDTFNHWYFKTIFTVREDRYAGTVPPSGNKTKVYFRIKAVDSAQVTSYSSVQMYDIDITAPTIENHTSPTVWRGTNPLYIHCNVSDDNRLKSAYLNWSIDNTTWNVDRMEEVSGNDTAKWFRTPLPVPSKNTTYIFRIFGYDEPGIPGNSSVYSFIWNPPPWINKTSISPKYPSNIRTVNITADIWDDDKVAGMWVQYSPNKIVWTNTTGTVSGTNWTATVNTTTATSKMYYYVWANDTDGGINRSDRFVFPVDSLPPTIHPSVQVPEYPNYTTPMKVVVGISDGVGVVNATLDYRYNWSSDWVTKNMTQPYLGTNLSVAGMAKYDYWYLPALKKMGNELGTWDAVMSGFYFYGASMSALVYSPDVLLMDSHGHRGWGKSVAINAAKGGSFVVVDSRVWADVLSWIDQPIFGLHTSHNITSKGIPLGMGAVIMFDAVPWTSSEYSPAIVFNTANVTEISDMAKHIRASYHQFAPFEAKIPKTSNTTMTFYMVHSMDLSGLRNNSSMMNYTTDNVDPGVVSSLGPPNPPYWHENSSYPVWVNVSDDRCIMSARLFWSYNQGASWSNRWLVESVGNGTSANFTGAVPPAMNRTKVWFYYEVWDKALNHVRSPVIGSRHVYTTSDIPTITNVTHEGFIFDANTTTNISARVGDQDGLSDVKVFYRIEYDPWGSVNMTRSSGSLFKVTLSNPARSGRMFYKVRALDAVGLSNESAIDFYWIEGTPPEVNVTHIVPSHPDVDTNVSVHGTAYDRMTNVTAIFDYKYGQNGAVRAVNATGGTVMTKSARYPQSGWQWNVFRKTWNGDMELVHLKVSITSIGTFTKGDVRVQGYVNESDVWEDIFFREDFPILYLKFDVDLKGYGFTKWRVITNRNDYKGHVILIEWKYKDPEFNATVPAPGYTTWVYYRIRASDSYNHTNTSQWGRFWADGFRPTLANHSAPQFPSAISGVNITATFEDESWMDRAELHWSIGGNFSALNMTSQSFNGTHLTSNATIPPTYLPINVTYFFKMYDAAGNWNTSRKFNITTAFLDMKEGVTYTFNAGKLIATSLIKKVEWDFDYQGAFNADKTGINASYKFDDNGTYKIAVRITDSKDTVWNWVFNATVLDQAPTAVISAITTVQEGTEVTFDGSGSTSPADTITKYEWDMDYNGTFNADKVGDKQNHTFTDNGTYVVALNVTDDDGSTTLAKFNITVTDARPELWVLHPYEVRQGDLVEFNASNTTSSVDAIVSYEWDFDYNGTFNVDATGNVTNHTYLLEGIYEVMLRVIDDDNSSSEYLGQVTVFDGIPKANITIIGQAVEGYQFALNATGSRSYPDNIVDYLWDLHYNGTFAIEVTGAVIPVSYQDEGAYRIALMVVDEDNSTDLLEMTLIVRDLSPDASFTGPIDVSEGEEVQYDASGSKSYPDEIASFQWDFDYTGTFTSDGSGSVVNHTYLDHGDYVIALRVYDDDGSYGFFTLNVTVGDKSPIAILRIEGDLVEGSELTLDGSLSTSNPDAITKYEWDMFFVQGNFSVDLVGAHAKYTYMESGTFLLALRVTDDDMSIGLVTIELTIADLGPEVSVNSSLREVKEGMTVRFDAVRLDGNPDDIVEYRWDWDGDGEIDVQLAGEVAFQVFQRPGEFTVILTVVDEDGSTSSGTFDITVTNVGPTAVLTVPSAKEGEMVTLDPSMSHEPGNNIIVYRWDLDGDGHYDAESNGSIEWSWTTPGSYTITLEVEDEAGATDSTTALLRISNVPPVADGGGPYEVFEGVSLILSADGSSEPGSDLVMFKWDLDGDSALETSTETAEVEHSWDHPGIYNLKLMVYDEDGSSDTVAFEVTVLDTPPTFELALPVDPVEGMATTYSVVNMSDPGTNENEFVVLWDFGDGKEGVGPEATHTYDSHGSYQGHVTVRDDDGTTTQIDWPDLLVVLNAAPTLDVGKQRYSLTEDKEFTLPLFARDPSSQTFIFDFTGPGGTLDPETGIFTWTPTDSDVGSHVFNFSVSDEEGAVAHQEVVLDIEDVDNDFMGMSLAIGMGMILALVLVIVLLAALVVWRRRRPPRAEPSPDEDSVNPEEGNEDEEEHLAAENTAESQHNEPPPQHDTTYEDLYGEPPPSH